MAGMSSVVSVRGAQDPRSLPGMVEAIRALGGRVQRLKTQAWDPQAATIDGFSDAELTYAVGDARWTSLLLPADALWWGVLALECSKRLRTTAVVIWEFDESAWGCEVFVEGSRSGGFCNNPSGADLDAARFRGDPTLLAQAARVPSATVARYLVTLDQIADGDEPRAFPDDEFPLTDHWVRVDLMRRMQIPYPDPSEGKGRWWRMIVPDRGYDPLAPPV